MDLDRVVTERRVSRLLDGAGDRSALPAVDRTRLKLADSVLSGEPGTPATLNRPASPYMFAAVARQPPHDEGVPP
jgi:hypothetical protein